MFFYQTPLSEKQIAIWEQLNQPNTLDMMSPIISKSFIDKLSTSLERIVIYFMDYKFDTMQTTTLLDQHTNIGTDTVNIITTSYIQQNITPPLLKSSIPKNN